MKTESTFAAFRYFLVPFNQMSLFDAVDEKRKVVLDAFFDKATSLKKVIYEIGDRKHILAYEREIDKNVYLFKFGVEKYETKYHESATGIDSVVEPNLPYVFLVFDTRRQLLLIEENSSVFNKVTYTPQKLQKCFEQEFFHHGFEVIFKEIIEENSFWNYVANSYSVHDVTVTLNSPNLFRGFIEIEKMLSDIRILYNNTKTTLRVSNKNAPLESIDKSNLELSSAVKYASGGGGEWSLTARTDKGKRTYHSKNNIKKVNLTPIIELTPEEEKSIFIGDNIENINKDIIKALDSVENILPKAEH